MRYRPAERWVGAEAPQKLDPTAGGAGARSDAAPSMACPGAQPHSLSPLGALHQKPPDTMEGVSTCRQEGVGGEGVGVGGWGGGLGAATSLCQQPGKEGRWRRPAAHTSRSG